jgi:hypothetical protein
MVSEDIMKRQTASNKLKNKDCGEIKKRLMI